MSVFKLFSLRNISGRTENQDQKSIWISWAQERAYRIGLILCSSAVVLSFIATIINFIYLGPLEVAADCILFFGCLASLYLTKRKGEARYFVWWPMLIGYWIAIGPNLYITGGITSPFFSTFMILLFVGAIVIQTEVRLAYVFSFVLVNIAGWAILEYFHPLSDKSNLPLAYNIMLNVDCLLAIAVCIYGFLKTEKDLSFEFEQRYQELASAQESLAREEIANASKSVFLANISHELRTPLGAILGYIDLILDESHSEADLREQLAIVKRNGYQLARLVDDLLDLSKIEAGRLEIEKLESNLLAVLGEIYETFSLAASKKNLGFNIKFLNPIPQKVMFDPIRFKQIMINLIGNSIKFTEEGKIEVNIEYIDSTEQLKVAIRDTGRGLTRDEQEKLFQPFSQADASMARKYGGTGLGLNLSRKLAQLMGGDLKLSFSRPGEGSIFTLWLDLRAAAGTPLVSDFTLSQPSLVATKSESASETKTLDGVSVLVVDDTADNRSLIKKLLELAGARVDVANDGTEGIQKALENPYQIVLMDIQMPGLDGLQATSLLRQRNYKRPIVALTAHAMKQDRERCIDAGCTDYLAKPVNRSELIATVARLTSASKVIGTVVGLNLEIKK